jgi:hypothetical protein
MNYDDCDSKNERLIKLRYLLQHHKAVEKQRSEINRNHSDWGSENERLCELWHM